MSTLTKLFGFHTSRILLAGLMALVVISGASILSAATQVALSGGSPAVTVTGVILNPAGVTCGTEVDCARVTWDVTVPKGATITGFSITLKVTRSNGTTETNTKPAAASARQLDMAAAFHTVDVKSYEATVTANYTASAVGTKSGNF